MIRMLRIQQLLKTLQSARPPEGGGLPGGTPNVYIDTEKSNANGVLFLGSWLSDFSHMDATCRQYNATIIQRILRRLHVNNGRKGYNMQATRATLILRILRILRILLAYSG